MGEDGAAQVVDGGGDSRAGFVGKKFRQASLQMFEQIPICLGGTLPGFLRRAEGFGVEKIGIDQAGKNHPREKCQAERLTLGGKLEGRKKIAAQVDVRQQFYVGWHLGVLQPKMQFAFLPTAVGEATVMSGNDVGQEDSEATQPIRGQLRSEGGMIDPC